MKALAEVEANDVAGVVDDLEQDRRLAAARWAAPDLADQSLAQELGDHLAHGRPGQTRDPRDVGAADRPEVIERPQDQALVVGSRLLVRRLGLEKHRYLDLPATTRRGPVPPDFGR